MSNRISTFLIIVLLFCSFRLTCLSKGTWFVNAENVADPLENGSVEHPYDTIQMAINMATNGDLIYVASGVYTGAGNVNLNYNGKDLFVLSENGPETTIIDCQDSSRGVVFENGEGFNAILMGFTISNGAADLGAGVYVENGAPIITDCVFVNNDAEQAGGGVYGGSIVNCVFSNNYAAWGGGACNANISSSVFDGNWAVYGAGVASGTVFRSSFISNTAFEGGGGIANSYVVESDISSNKAAWGGGTYQTDVEDCKIYGNTADYGGGCNYGAIQASLIYSNTAKHGGGTVDGLVINCDLFHNKTDPGLAEDDQSIEGSGGGSAYSVLVNCQIYENESGMGGGVAFGKLTNCRVYANLANDGGGLYESEAHTCTISQNELKSVFYTYYQCKSIKQKYSAGNHGGGVFGGVIKDSVIVSNTALYGGGMFKGENWNCIFMDNQAEWGGGCNISDSYFTVFKYNVAQNGGAIADGLARNCVIQENESELGGGAIAANLENCTVLYNTSRWSGSGVLDCTVVNCILYENRLSVEYLLSNYEESEVTYSCAVPLAPGIGNISADPQLITLDYPSILSGSPVINSGTNLSWMSSDTDIRGAYRIVDEQVDMGVIEYNQIHNTGDLAVSILNHNRVFINDHSFNLRSKINGQPDYISWDMGNGEHLESRELIEYTYNTTGVYTVTLTVENDSSSVSTSVILNILSSFTNYVDLDCTNSVYPFNTPNTAATNIQEAIDAVPPGGSTIVMDGFYLLDKELIINSPMMLSSINGTNMTILDALYQSSCIHVKSSNVFIEGFTIQHGHAPEAGGGVLAFPDTHISKCNIINCIAPYGGGIAWGIITSSTIDDNRAIIDGGGTYYSQVDQCRIINNKGQDYKMSRGGGIFGGIVYSSTIQDNSAVYGGGAYDANIYDSIIASNSATFRAKSVCYSYEFIGGAGGGACYGILSNSVIHGNTANSYTLNYGGGGLSYVEAYSCKVIYNSTTTLGGGAANSYLRNCFLMGNRSDQGGGGIYSSTNINCTIIFNSSPHGGGGANNSRSTNTIIMYNINEKDSEKNNYDNTVMSFSCSEPLPEGSGNINMPPLLSSIGEGRLLADSPCINAGTNFSWMANTKDGLGNPRIKDSVVDIGWDEYQINMQTGAVEISWYIDGPTHLSGETFEIWSVLKGKVDGLTWEDSSGLIASNSVFITRTYMTTGVYQVVLSAWNSSGLFSSTIEVWVVDTTYADVNSDNSQWPYTTLDTAATNIQDALNAVSYGGRTLVADGVYVDGNSMDGYEDTLIVVDTNKTLESINGPQNTKIIANSFYVTNNIRCVYLNEGSQIKGFTITGGYLEGYYSYGSAIYAKGSNLIESCKIHNNYSSHHGVVYSYQDLEILNSMIVSNMSKYEYSDLVEVRNGLNVGHSTIVNNSGNINWRDANIYNSIIYNNSPISQFGSSINISYSCLAKNYLGEGNIAINPQLDNNYRLRPFSPCIDSAIATNISEDIFATSRPQDGNGDGLSLPDMGAYEFYERPMTGFFSVNVMLETNLVSTGDEFSVEARLGGDVSHVFWFVNDELVEQDSVELNYQLNQAGRYDVVIVASNLSTSVRATGVIYIVDTNYVDINNHTPEWPYITWETAATNIQDALDVIPEGGTTKVNDGVYDFGSRIANRDNTRVVVGKNISLESKNGPQNVCIVGNSDLTSNNIRCVYLDEGASIKGFTIAGGSLISINRYGGGVYAQYSNHIEACIIVNNDAHIGGGVYANDDVDIINTLIVSNNAMFGGGVNSYGVLTLGHCTVVNNTADHYNYGEGVRSSYVNIYNSIVYDNSLDINSSNNTNIRYTCVSDQWTGEGNIHVNPQLNYSNYKLTRFSPCIDNALLTNINVDLMGNERPYDGDRDGHSLSDMGAYEFYDYSMTGSLSVVLEPYIALPDKEFQLPCRLWGDMSHAEWYYNDDLIELDSLVLTHQIGDLGKHEVVLIVSNQDNITSVTGSIYIVEKTYVDISNPIPEWPYMSWETAATNIQDALTTIPEGGETLVVAGLYNDGIVTNIYGYQTRVNVKENCKLLSIDGPEVTIIDADQNNNCVYLESGAEIDGFTIQGAKYSGLKALSSNLIRNCMIENNGHFERYSYVYGGGAWISNGLIADCIIYNNFAKYGGGLNCNNTIIEKCIIQNNQASYGGGLYVDGGSNNLINTLITGNYAEEKGAGVYCDTTTYTFINHSTIADNLLQELENSIYSYSSNSMSVFNSIILGSFENSTRKVFYSCLSSNIYGLGNIVADPQLDVDYYPSPASPVIDRIESNSVVLDLNSIPRPLDGDNDGVAKSDMGCYEFINQLADSDNDQMVDGDEFIAGTDPLDPTSLFEILHIKPIGGFPQINWTTVISKNYFLERAYNLANPHWETVYDFPVTQIDTNTESSIGMYDLMNSATNSQVFYRIRVE